MKNINFTDKLITVGLTTLLGISFMFASPIDETMEDLFETGKLVQRMYLIDDQRISLPKINNIHEVYPHEINEITFRLGEGSCKIVIGKGKLRNVTY